MQVTPFFAYPSRGGEDAFHVNVTRGTLPPAPHAKSVITPLQPSM